MHFSPVVLISPLSKITSDNKKESTISESDHETTNHRKPVGNFFNYNIISDPPRFNAAGISG